MLWNINKKNIAEKQIWTEASLADVKQEYAYRIRNGLLQNKRATYTFPNTPKSK